MTPTATSKTPSPSPASVDEPVCGSSPLVVVGAATVVVSSATGCARDGELVVVPAVVVVWPTVVVVCGTVVVVPNCPAHSPQPGTVVVVCFTVVDVEPVVLVVPCVSGTHSSQTVVVVVPSVVVTIVVDALVVVACVVVGYVGCVVVGSGMQASPAVVVVEQYQRGIGRASAVIEPTKISEPTPIAAAPRICLIRFSFMLSPSCCR
jgi:hypothetical protein